MLDDIRPADWIELATIMIGGIGAIFAMKSDIKVLAQSVKAQGRQLEAQSAELKQLATIVRDQAVMHERMNAIDRTIDEMRHGRGFVLRQIEYPNAAPTIFEK